MGGIVCLQEALLCVCVPMAHQCSEVENRFVDIFPHLHLVVWQDARVLMPYASCSAQLGFVLI